MVLIFLSLFSTLSWAALPPQFSECLNVNSSSTMSVADMKALAEVTRVTYCQNQVGPIGKLEVQSLLESPNMQIGISVVRTSYSITDFLDLANAGTYVLYVDGPRLTRDNLRALAEANVRLVFRGTSSGLSKADLIAIAEAKPVVLDVNMGMSSVDIADYIAAGMDVVIRMSQAGLSSAELATLAQLNTAKVTILP